MYEPEELMRLAIDKCREGIAAGQSPFGCAISQGDRLLAVSHNTVLKTMDITAHAEINALRKACCAASNIFLESALVATTCEPCPMCMAALHWARVARVVYGATIQEADQAGFNELQVPASEIIRLGRSDVELVPGVFQQECRDLFQLWRQNPNAESY